MSRESRQTEISEALLDVLDMLGALAGSHRELSGWGLSEERQLEIWSLGQQLLQQKAGVDL